MEFWNFTDKNTSTFSGAAGIRGLPLHWKQESQPFFPLYQHSNHPLLSQLALLVGSYCSGTTTKTRCQIRPGSKNALSLKSHRRHEQDSKKLGLQGHALTSSQAVAHVPHCWLLVQFSAQETSGGGNMCMLQQRLRNGDFLVQSPQQTYAERLDT